MHPSETPETPDPDDLPSDASAASSDAMPAESADDAPQWTDDAAGVSGERSIAVEHDTPLRSAASGNGPWLIDAAGRRYFDAIASAAGCSLGYSSPEVIAAIRRQVGQWIGTTPLAPDPLVVQATEQIGLRSLGGPVALTASGSEANEAAIRLVRWLGRGQRYKVITFAGSYHGATLGSLTASGDPQLHQHVGPLAAGFTYCPYGDAGAVAAAIDDATAAILVQPLQTHDQMRLPPEGFLASLRALADEQQLLLVVDETQLPIGLSGSWFAYQRSGVQPDLLTLSAGLAGGLGVGALAMRDAVADELPPPAAWPARHDPLAAAAILATLEAIERDDLLQHAGQIAELLAADLHAIRDDFDPVRSVSCLGLMIGIELDVDAETLIADCRRRGLLLGRAGDSTLRMQPPLVTAAAEGQQLLEIVRSALEAVQQQPAET